MTSIASNHPNLPSPELSSNNPTSYPAKHIRSSRHLTGINPHQQHSRPPSARINLLVAFLPSNRPPHTARDQKNLVSFRTQTPSSQFHSHHIGTGPRAPGKSTQWKLWKNLHAIHDVRSESRSSLSQSEQTDFHRKMKEKQSIPFKSKSPSGEFFF